MHRMLLPGTHLLRRPDGRVQAGLDPGQAVVLPPGRPVSALQADGDPAVVRALDAAGLLVDEAVVRTAARAWPVGEPGQARPSPGAELVAWTRHAAAALVRATGPQAAGTLARRGQAVLGVRGFGGALADALVQQVRELAVRAGVAPDGAAGRGRRRRLATVGVAVGVGEPDRALLDPWLQRGLPHVVVRLTEGRVLLGPFVDPGRTACLRCLDAHRTDEDPDWPLLVQQYADGLERGRVDGVPEPVDPSLATLAVGWALRDVVTFVEGQRPTTWSTTLLLSARLEELRTVPWLRHPECGCSWA
jgi:bacteriocin biosynthesis cyclodehydratase domain-containing protein